MRAIIVQTGRRISPFDDAPGDTPVLDQTLREFQLESLRAAGFVDIDVVEPDHVAPPEPCLVVTDDLFFGRRLAEEFVRRSRKLGGRTVVALEPGVFTREHAPLQDVELTAEGTPIHPMYYLPEGGSMPAGLDGVSVITVPLNEELLKIPVPEHYFGKTELEVPFTARPAIRVRHWMHVLWTNRTAMSERRLRLPKWRRLATVLWALVRCGWPTLHRMLNKLSVVGRGSSIHPTAVIEGSVLGKNVRVGAHAMVRFSYLADNCMIMDGARVSFCTLSEGASVMTNCVLNFSVLYKNASSAQPLMQLCVLGRSVVTTGGGFFMDMSLDKDEEIRVVHNGEVVSSGQRFLGSAVGHDAIVGTGFWMAYGREIPSGYIIVRDPDQVLRRIPTDLPRGVPLAVRGGTLVPMLPAAKSPSESPNSAGDEAPADDD